MRVNALHERNIPTAEISIGAIHWHVLCQFASQDRDPKLLIGQAKGKCAFVLGKQGIVKPGGIWAKGCRTLPINDENHFWNAKKYIHDHILEGAAVLSEIMQLPPFTP